MSRFTHQQKLVFVGLHVHYEDICSFAMFLASNNKECQILKGEKLT